MDLKSSEIGVGLVGYKFMGRAHSNAYRCQAVLDAVERSKESGSWTEPAARNDARTP